MNRPLPHIAQMSPYALAKLEPPPGVPLTSLSQNESIRPPSPAAIAAGVAALERGALYPDPDWTDLRQALAEVHDVDGSKILCGNGSLDLIGALARVFAGPDRAVLAPAHAYPYFRTVAQIANARFDIAAEENATVSVDTLLAAVKPDTAIVFVANPGNPTGTRIPSSDLRRLRDGLDPAILLVIDEAYGEFSDHLDARLFDLTNNTNTVVLRTLSKAYGMAGYRVGWGYFPTEIGRELRKVLNPNNVSGPSQAAAVAAVNDQAYMRETCQMTATLRDDLAARITALGLRIYPSFTNFLLIDFGSASAARIVDLELQKEGIFVRGQTGAGLPEKLRVTLGSEAAHDRLIKLLDRLKDEVPT